MTRVSSVYPELDGRRKLAVRPWNVREGDRIEFCDSARHPIATFLVEVTDDPINMGRGLFSGVTRYRILVRKLRPLSGHTYWDPHESTWYARDRVEVYR